MPTDTPNIGLQVPDYNQANWQVPNNFNWNLLDLIFGGVITVPALSVTTLVVGNVGALFAAVFAAEAPSGAIPGNTFTLSSPPSLLIGFYVNGLFQRPGVDYTVSGSVITMTYSTSSGDTVYATYLS